MVDVEVLRPSNFRPARIHTPGRACIMLLVALICSASLNAQTGSSELRQILDRLEGLERANRELTEEVRALRGQLAAANPPGTDGIRAAGAQVTPGMETAAGDRVAVEEQVAVQKRQIEEQAQTKVESSQRFPIRLKGMLLFNTFLNSKLSGGAQYPSVAAQEGDGSGGATFRQSIIGFDYRGPEVFGGGKLHASLLMDFFGGSGQSLDQALRIRTANVQVDWKSRSLSLGVDKPIFAPREPSSMAQVGISPLTGAGNLWMWIPQLRFEQILRLSDSTEVRAQAGIVQTHEIPSYQAIDYVAEVAPARPGAEGRVEFSHNFGNGRRIEIAPGFHLSTSHIAHAAVPSKLVSMDWLIAPWRMLEVTGAYYTGQNVSHLGTGGIGQGFDVVAEQNVKALRGKGGWTQLTIPATERLSFHFFGGIQDDRNPELPTGQIGKNLSYGANFFYRLAPNLVMSLEASQVRTDYINLGHRLNNHYDLGFAYLF